MGDSSDAPTAQHLPPSLPSIPASFLVHLRMNPLTLEYIEAMMVPSPYRDAKWYQKALGAIVEAAFAVPASCESVLEPWRSARSHPGPHSSHLDGQNDVRPSQAPTLTSATKTAEGGAKDGGRKRRQRPINYSESDDTLATPAEGALSEESCQPEKKRRHPKQRGENDAIENDPTNASTEGTPPKKKRGRPPKMQSQKDIERMQKQKERAAAKAAARAKAIEVKKEAAAAKAAAKAKVIEEKFESMFEKLRQHKEERRTVDFSSFEKASELKKWIETLKFQYRQIQRGRNVTILTPVRLSRLTALGLKLHTSDGKDKPPRKSWEERLEQFKLYVEEHGHSDVPADHELYSWIKNNQMQAQYYELGKHEDPSSYRPTSNRKINDEKYQKLVDAGFPFRTSEYKPQGEQLSFDKRYAQLVDFKRENGHCVVPQHYNGKHAGLGHWVHGIRRKYRNMTAGKGGPKAGILTPSQLLKLTEVGFVFNATYRRGSKLSKDYRKVGGRKAGI